jgi:hypothetical protein
MSFKTKWFVLGGKEWGEEEVLLKFEMLPNVDICSEAIFVVMFNLSVNKL